MVTCSSNKAWAIKLKETMEKNMKTKILILAALLGAAAMSANAGVRFGFTVALPQPVIVSTPVVYATPVLPVPAPVVEAVPPCPGVDYVWAPGYWTYHTNARVWVSGAWHYRPAHAVFGYRHGGYRR